MKRASLFLLLMMLCVQTVLMAAGCDGSSGEAKAVTTPQEEKRIRVSVLEVQPTRLDDILSLPGQTLAWEDVNVSADQGGRVEWVGPREGRQVKNGDLLAKVDVKTLKAVLDNAKADVDLARNLFESRKSLFERKIISREDFIRMETELEVKRGVLRQAEVAYEQGFIRSPINGLINALHVEHGEFVARGDPVFNVVNIDRIKVDVSVPELDVRHLKVGDQALAAIDAFPGETLGGIIDFVAFKADEVTKTFLVRVVIENAEHRIRPGMIARVAFVRRNITDALVVPLFALVDKAGERLVFVDDNGTVRARQVEIGVIDSARVQIVKGLNPGDKVIVVGQTEVEEGTKVIAE
ncbi:MAG: efflux RND transporter periplasmic adaptor subunit [Pseudomonadota bacterium]